MVMLLWLEEQELGRERLNNGRVAVAGRTRVG